MPRQSIVPSAKDIISFDVNITDVNKRIYDFDKVKNLIDWLKTKVA